MVRFGSWIAARVGELCLCALFRYMFVFIFSICEQLSTELSLPHSCNTRNFEMRQQKTRFFHLVNSSPLSPSLFLFTFSVEYFFGTCNSNFYLNHRQQCEVIFWTGNIWDSIEELINFLTTIFLSLPLFFHLNHPFSEAEKVFTLTIILKPCVFIFLDLLMFQSKVAARQAPCVLQFKHLPPICY